MAILFKVCKIVVFNKFTFLCLDLTEHALYVAVRDHEIRPPISKLTNMYPRNLLVLIMEMWETDPLLVRAQ
jgi:hypothetical protein